MHNAILNTFEADANCEIEVADAILCSGSATGAKTESNACRHQRYRYVDVVISVRCAL